MTDGIGLANTAVHICYE